MISHRQTIVLLVTGPSLPARLFHSRRRRTRSTNADRNVMHSRNPGREAVYWILVGSTQRRRDAGCGEEAARALPKREPALSQRDCPLTR